MSLPTPLTSISFNEAGAFPPRKSFPGAGRDRLLNGASMRPGRFHPGNNCARSFYVRLKLSFNEAGAFPPRKSLMSYESRVEYVKLQ